LQARAGAIWGFGARGTVDPPVGLTERGHWRASPAAATGTRVGGPRHLL